MAGGNSSAGLFFFFVDAAGVGILLLICLDL
jgi:hypothetical protein